MLRISHQLLIDVHQLLIDMHQLLIDVHQILIDAHQLAPILHRTSTHRSPPPVSVARRFRGTFNWEPWNLDGAPCKSLGRLTNPAVRIQ